MQEQWWQLDWTAISIWACHRSKRSWDTVMELWNIEKERDYQVNKERKQAGCVGKAWCQT
jgi:hypothetical protein